MTDEETLKIGSIDDRPDIVEARSRVGDWPARTSGAGGEAMKTPMDLSANISLKIGTLEP
jgi:hypothetical protein